VTPRQKSLRERLGPTLVIATHNAGKLKELGDLFGASGPRLVSAAELGLPEPEETGDSFQSNARLKARAAAFIARLPALADDSGLAVDALGGAPGVFSARWAGEGRDFSAAMARVERELRAVGAPSPWSAHFLSALAFAWPDGSVEVYEGRVDGTLVFPPRGSLGFGYDPIFLPDGHDRTFGEMTREEKHGLLDGGGRALSHRARAFQAVPL